MIPTLADLHARLADWYEVEPSALTLPRVAVAHIAHPVLSEFYQRFGALAEPDTPFRHPATHLRPLDAQDRVVRASELPRHGGIAPFLLENQCVFTVAAPADPACDEALVHWGEPSEDAALYERTGVPLSEILVTFLLQETILSAQDCRRRRDEDAIMTARESAVDGLGIRSRYVWDEAPSDFLLTADRWFLASRAISDRDRPIHFDAGRGDWALPPAPYPRGP